MKLQNLTAGVTDWSRIPAQTQEGEFGTADARASSLGEIQIRLVEYSAGYVADHWCSKGHIIFVVAGQLVIEHQDGKRHRLAAGMSYHVADDEGPPHRVLSDGGATLFIVD
jgi:hypothetical protein